MNAQQAEIMSRGEGFIAALDQSGGSTPKALRQYGIGEDAYETDAEMFRFVHEMRTRIITSPAFTSGKVLATILFEDTMDREVEGRPTAEYLWREKGIVPILKTDKGLAEQADGVSLMKPNPGLDELCSRAVEKGIFGTKMRSFIAEANADGIRAVVDQQFAEAVRILEHGLVPIIEPEVDITAGDRAEAEDILLAEILSHLETLPEGRQVMVKISIPVKDDLYRPLIEHPRVMRVVALSGGYGTAEANERLARNHGLIASFSRALTESLRADQDEEEFNARLAEAVDGIYRASLT